MQYGMKKTAASEGWFSTNQKIYKREAFFLSKHVSQHIGLGARNLRLLKSDTIISITQTKITVTYVHIFQNSEDNKVCLSLYIKIISLPTEQHAKQFHSSTDKSPKREIPGFLLRFQTFSST
jgi:hypothetical protein